MAKDFGQDFEERDSLKKKRDRSKKEAEAIVSNAE